MRKVILAIISVVLCLIPANSVFASDIDSFDQAQMTVDNVVFIGDSYCMGAGAGSPDAGWAELTAKKMKLEHYFRSCLGGTGFSKTRDDKNFESLAVDAVVNVWDTDTIEWVVVEGGYNDRTESDDAIIEDGASLIQYLTEAFPKAQILIGVNGWNIKDTAIQDEIDRVRALIQQLALSFNITYIQGSEDVLYGHAEYFSSDNYHPNLAGQTALADFLADYLQERANALAAEKLLEEQNAKNPASTNTHYSFAIILILLMTVAVAVVFNVRRTIAASRKK